MTIAENRYVGRIRGGLSSALQLAKNPLSMIGIAIIVVFVFTAIFASFIAPYPEDVMAVHMDARLLPPSMNHLLGTDEMGRDIFSRTVIGSRVSLMVIGVVVGLSAGIGVLIGAVAGFLGGKVDEAAMRVTDMFLAFPSILLAMAVAAALGPSLMNAMIAITTTWWPWYARLVRGQVLSMKERPFVEAAVTLGAGKRRIVFRHILPNCISPILVQISMDAGYVLLTAAGLSFIGLGAQPPTPEWGLMISLGRLYMPQWWWLATFPGLAIMLTVLGFNLIGDTLMEMLEPRGSKVG